MTEPLLVDCDRFFHPLDAIGDWNRLHGARGFLQYQCMIPERDAADGMRRVLAHVVRSRRASCLALLKRLGPASPGPLAFPGKGLTLALDLPMTGDDVLRSLDELDEIVIGLGGRVYLAKDARLSADRLRLGRP